MLEHNLKSPLGNTIYYWTVGKKTNPPLLLVHGLLEHSSRYHEMAQFLSHDFYVVGFDLPGHGLSSGSRGHIDKFNDFVEAATEVINKLKLKNFRIYAHSMGALIAYLLFKKNSYEVSGIFFHNPAFFMKSEVFSKMSEFKVSSVQFSFGKLQIPFHFNVKDLVRDEGERQKIQNDYLMGTRLSFQMMKQLLVVHQYFEENLFKNKKPFFLYQCMNDSIVSAKENILCLENVVEEQYIDHDFLHEAHFDTGKKAVWDKVKSFFDKV